MKLSIGHLGIHVQAAATSSIQARRCATYLEERVPVELSSHLGPSLDEQQVVRIRSLKLRLRVAAGQLTEEDVIQAWLTAFSKELFRSLQMPSEPDALGVYRAPSSFEHRASFIRELLRGGRSQEWFFEEFRPYLRLARSAAVYELLLSGAETLRVLAREGALEGALSVLNEVELEALMRALSQGGEQEISAPFILDLLKTAIAVSVPNAWRLGGHRYALLLWAKSELCRSVSPRPVLHALQAVESIHRSGWKIPAGVSETVRPWLHAMTGLHAELELRTQISRAIESLLQSSGGIAVAAIEAEEHWLRSQYAGILLTLPFWARLKEVRLPKKELAGLVPAVALCLCGRPQDAAMWGDPAVYTFAGKTVPRVAAGSDWALARTIADALALELGRSIRSLRSLSAESIGRMFLRKPGRILLGERRMQVVMDPSAYNIVLHTAGLDGGPSELPEWFQDRELVLHLEGL